MELSNLKIVKGNLLDSDCDIIVHQANCLGIMGAGIARQIKFRYPEVYEADLNFKESLASKKRLGKYSKAKVDDKIVVNLYSQFGMGIEERQTDYEAMKEGLVKLCENIKSVKEVKIGFPYVIGAGLAGGDPEYIKQILNEVAKEYDRVFYLYKL